jgi:hypothetical protein
MGKVLLALCLVAVWCASARAQSGSPKTGDLIASFGCPTATCTTTCVGPGGNFNIVAKTLKVYYFKEQPRRLWINADETHTVLGDDHNCQFGGFPQIPPTNLNPTGTPATTPGRVCVGDTCIPPR